MARRIEVEIVGDSRSLERAFKRSEASAKQFNQSVKKRGAGIGDMLGAKAGALFTAGSITAGIKETIDAASDLNEQMSKSNVVFGKSADQVTAWSRKTVREMGLSQRQALGVASSFGALLTPLGIVGEKAAQQSEQLTQLGADLASFYNTDVQSALDAIRSGLVGESEPLRRYGVQLSEARVQQEAMAETGKKHVKELTNQEKTLARIAIIYRDSAKAQGDFARTSEGLANQSRIAAANVDQLKTNIGEGLIPAVLPATQALNDMADALRRVHGWSQKSGDGLEGFARKAARTIFRNVNPRAAMRAAIPGPIQQAFRLARHFWPKSTPGSPLGRGTPADMRSQLAPLVPAGLWLKPPPAQQLNKVEEAGKKAGQAIRAAWAKGATSKQAKAQLAAGKRFVELRNTWFDDMIGRQLGRVGDVGLRGQLHRLRRIAREIQARLASTKDPTRRLNLQDQLLDIAKQENDVHKQITDNIKKGNQALRDRADAIKSAVLGQLSLNQQVLEDKQNLQDALKDLRLAQAIGGPGGIRVAGRAVQKARYELYRDQLARQTPTLTKGGQFAYGGVTINVHGVTDPEKVARTVVAVLERRKRHTSTQSRGASVDAGASTAPR